jgi:hypothetical protein
MRHRVIRPGRLQQALVAKGLMAEPDKPFLSSAIHTANAARNLAASTGNT